MEAEKCQAIKLIFKSIYFFEKSFHIFQIHLYLSNRFQFLKSAFQIGLYFSNRFLSFKWIYVFILFKSHVYIGLYFSNPSMFSKLIQFFKPTLVTCFFFPKRLISSRSFSIFLSKIQIGLYISNQLNNFQINLYFPNQLN